jgi:GNAT superfamily N-acetyltransferase
MLNLSSESLTLQSADDEERHEIFREMLRPHDIGFLRRLVTDAGVFNADEIAMACEVAEEALGSSDGAGYCFLLADGSAGLERYTCYGLIPGTDRRYELYWIVTAASAQRHGLARALLEATETKIRKRRGTYLFVETSTREDYGPAHPLYASLGYQRHCIVPDYHGDGDGLAIFGKRL